MGRMICLWLLAFLALGSAVPVPDSASKSASLTQQDILDKIREANPNDNDIGVLPMQQQTSTDEPGNKDQVTSESSDPETPEPTTENLIDDVSTSSVVEETKVDAKPALEISANQTEVQNEGSTIPEEQLQNSEDIPVLVIDDEPLEIYPDHELPVPVYEEEAPLLPLGDDEVILIPSEQDFFDEEEELTPIMDEPFEFGEEEEEVELDPLTDEQISYPSDQYMPEDEYPVPLEESEDILSLPEEIAPFEIDDPYMPPVNEEIPFVENEQVTPDSEFRLIGVPLEPVVDEPVMVGEEPTIPDLEEILSSQDEEEPIMIEIDDPVQEEDEEFIPIIEREVSFAENEQITQILGEKVAISNIEPINANSENPLETEGYYQPAEEQIFIVNAEETPDGMIMGPNESEQTHMIRGPEEIYVVIESDLPLDPVPEEPIIPGFLGQEPGFGSPLPPYFGEEIPHMEEDEEDETPVYFDTPDETSPFDTMPVASEEPIIIPVPIPSIDAFPMTQSGFPFVEEPVDDAREDYFIPEDNLTVEDAFNKMPVMSDKVEDGSMFMDDSGFVSEAMQEPAVGENIADTEISGFLADTSALDEDVPSNQVEYAMATAEAQNTEDQSDELVIDVMQTGIFPEEPEQFPFGVPLPLDTFGEATYTPGDFEDYSDDQVDEDEQIVPFEEFLPEEESYSPFGIPITFPESVPPQHNLPVFPQEWSDENSYSSVNDGDIYPDIPPTFEPFATSDSSYSQYNPSAVGQSSYGPPTRHFHSYRPPSSPPEYLNPQLFSFGGNDQTDEIFQEPTMMEPNFETGMTDGSMEPQVSETFASQGMTVNDGDSHFHSHDETYQNSGLPITPQRFNTLGVSRMPSLQDIAMRYDYHGPNTFPLNFRNPYGGMNVNFNKLNDAYFMGSESQLPIQQEEAYGIGVPFTPYGTYQNSPFDSRYPMVTRPNPFSSYQRRPYGFYPYGEDKYQRSGLYPLRPLNRYAFNDRYGDFRPYGYPTPNW